MKIIEPSAERWTANSWQEMVAKAARVCYASKGGKRTDEEMCNMLWDSGHRSMFRHGTMYAIMPYGDARSKEAYSLMEYCPYVYKTLACRFLGGELHMCVAANIQFVKETWIGDYIEEFSVTEDEYKSFLGKDCLRYTICLVTQISTSRELNRTSPNNIAEQSTRYVNFGKRGGIAICRPHWYNKIGRTGRFLTRLYWHACEFAYNTALRFGLPAQDAREFLPLCAATKVVYTYTRDEWEHILDLRLRGTTGTPHPNAKEAAQLINNLLN